MYDIVTLEPEDPVVMTAINAIVNNKACIAAPEGGFRFFAVNAKRAEGDGGANKHVLVVVGHGGLNSLSGYPSWAAFRDSAPDGVDWAGAAQVYIAACSTLGDGKQFLYGSIAREIKADFPDAQVWVSTSNVSGKTLRGDWQMLQ